MELKCEGAGKWYYRQAGEANHFYAVRPVSLTLAPGKLVVLHGRSGSGKTTLLNMLSGLLAPSEGQVFAGEQALYALGDRELSRFRNQHIGVIPQGKAMVGTLSVLENVLLPRTLYGRAPEREKALALLESLEIGHLAGVRPGELSGGELRRAAIARALHQEPEILLADEPTGDLDDEMTGRVLHLLREKARRGAAVLLVTHEKEALSFGDVCWRMDAGTLQTEA